MWDDVQPDDYGPPDDDGQPGRDGPVPEPEPTGDPAVDEATRDLADSLRQPSADGEIRVVAFEAAHRALQDRLADVES